VVPPGFEPLVPPLPAPAVPPGFLPLVASTTPAVPHVAQSSPVAPGAATSTTAAPRVAPEAPTAPRAASAPPVVTDGPPPREWPSSPIVYAKAPSAADLDCAHGPCFNAA
jgi:hypothetical protein